jgi:hypothetical protein
MRKTTKYSIYRKTLSIYPSIHLSNLGEDHEGDDGEAAAVEYDPHVQLAPPRPVPRPVDPRSRVDCLDERKVVWPRLEREEGDESKGREWSAARASLKRKGGWWV